MSYFLGRIIGITALFFGMLCLWKPTWDFFLSRYQEMSWTFLVTLLATLIGVFLAFQLEKHRESQAEINVFKRNFASIMSETAENKSKINFFLKKDTSPTVNNLPYLDIGISGLAISNPLIYKYTGDEYWIALKAYIQSAQRVNTSLETVVKDGELVSQRLQPINTKLQLALRYISILQLQTALYIQAYDVRTGPRPGNYQHIVDLLTGKEESSLEEIQAETLKIQGMTEEEKKQLREGLREVLGLDNR